MGWSNAGWLSSDGGWYKNAAAAGGAFSLTFGSSASASGGPTVDYGTMAYPSGATRIVVANLWIPGTASNTITGITIGLVPLAQVSGAYVQAAAGGENADVWQSTGPLSGSSGDVVVTYSSALTFTSSVALYGLVTTTPTAATAVVASTGFGSTVSTSGLVVPAGGGAIVLSAGGNGAALTQTNTSVDASITPGGNHAYYGHTTSTGAITVTSATVSGNDSIALSVVAWSP